MQQDQDNQENPAENSTKIPLLNYTNRDLHTCFTFQKQTIPKRKCAVIRSSCRGLGDPVWQGSGCNGCPASSPGHQDVSMSDTRRTFANLVRRLRGSRMIEIKTRSRIHISSPWRLQMHRNLVRKWGVSGHGCNPSRYLIPVVNVDGELARIGQPELVLMTILYKCFQLRVCLLFSRFSCNMEKSSAILNRYIHIVYPPGN